MNKALSSVLEGRSSSKVCLIYIKRQDYRPTAEGPQIECYPWAQGNKAVQDAGGFFDLILTEAANMANTVPEMFDPLAAIGMPAAPPRGDFVASVSLSSASSAVQHYESLARSSIASRHAR